MKKLFSALLALIMLFILPFTANASYNIEPLDRAGWDERYNSLCDDNTLPMLCVGADQTQLSLVWHADAAAAQPQVRWADTAEMTDYITFTGTVTPAETEQQSVCRVNITGIDEYSVYYYQWNTGSGWSEPCRYESNGFDAYKVMVIGDIQIGGQTESREVQSDIGYTWNSILAEALTKNPDVSFLVSPGDNTSTGKTADEWQTLLKPKVLRNLPLALAIGNHDKKGLTYNYYTNMPNEFYGEYFTGIDRDFWFRYGDVLYLFFDACSSSAADHMAMAEQAVKENPDAKWRIGVMHQALFGAGGSGYDPETAILLNAVFTPIFDTYDVDLVITGHSHAQGRSKFIFESIVVGDAKSGETYINPKGTVYLNTNAVCDQAEGITTPYLDYCFTANDVTTYSTLEFYGNTMELKTFRGDNSNLLDSLTIEKDVGHQDLAPTFIAQRLLYKFVEFFGWIYGVIDAIVVANRGGSF